MRFRNLVLTVVVASAVATVGGCGATPEQQEENRQQRIEEQEKAPVENSGGLLAYEVTLKDGRVVQCVVSNGVYETSLDCDFPTAE